MTPEDLEAIKQRAEAASYGPAEDKEEVCRYDIPALIARVEELEAEHTKALDLWQDSTRDEHILRALLRRALPCVDAILHNRYPSFLSSNADELANIAATIRAALGEEWMVRCKVCGLERPGSEVWDDGTCSICVYKEFVIRDDNHGVVHYMVGGKFIPVNEPKVCEKPLLSETVVSALTLLQTMLEGEGDQERAGMVSKLIEEVGVEWTR